MSEHTFAAWLRRETTAAKYSLLTLHEQRDKLLYIDGPRLEQEYMDKLGSYEENVIREEIECEILKKKQQMIQTALNRREPIDEAAIDAELDILRQQMLKEAAGSAAPSTYAELTEEENDELQELYSEIVKDFHPQMHPELTEVHHRLFQKAQDAYRRRNLPTLRLIYQMLISTQGETIPLEELLKMLEPVKAEDAPKGAAAIKGQATDFTLAAALYSCFKPTVEEAAIREQTETYRQTSDAVIAEMEALRAQFPYTAAEVLADSTKVEAYKKELEVRLHAAAQERERREQEIREMIERAVRYE